MSKLGDVCWVKKCTVIQMYRKRESEGEAPSCWAIFRDCLKKIILMPLDHISHVFEVIWKD